VTNTKCHTDTVISPDDGCAVAENVEKRNKHPKKNCAPSWLYLQDYKITITPCSTSECFPEHAQIHKHYMAKKHMLIRALSIQTHSLLGLASGSYAFKMKQINPDPGNLNTFQTYEK
jgi:hypothetical protein